MNTNDVAILTADTIIKTNIDVTICEIPAEKLFQIRKENKSQDNLKNISGKDLIFIGASSWIGQFIAYIAKAEGGIVHGISRENGVDVREKSTLNAAFHEVFKKNGRLDFIIILLGC